MRGWVLLLTLMVGIARADGEEPWQVGVGEDQKQLARQKLDEGNALYVQNLYREAAAAYETALATWNHPAIRFNLAKTLIALDRPIEAFDQLELAMQFGPKPLGEVWGEAVNYQSLLGRQLATLTVRCTQPGVELVVDATPLAPCPTTSTTRVRPGRHTITARKAGYLTVTREETVLGGEAPAIDITLISLQDAAITRTRWATWKPWAVASAGALVVGAGVLVELDARAKLDDYRAALRTECGEAGCQGGLVSRQTAVLEDQARTRDRIAVTLMIAGGVGAAVGVTMLVLNRPVTEIPSQRLAWTPLVGTDSVGLAVTGRM